MTQANDKNKKSWFYLIMGVFYGMAGALFSDAIGQLDLYLMLLLISGLIIHINLAMFIEIYNEIRRGKKDEHE